MQGSVDEINKLSAKEIEAEEKKLKEAEKTIKKRKL